MPVRLSNEVMENDSTLGAIYGVSFNRKLAQVTKTRNFSTSMGKSDPCLEKQYSHFFNLYILHPVPTGEELRSSHSHEAASYYSCKIGKN